MLTTVCTERRREQHRLQHSGTTDAHDGSGADEGVQFETFSQYLWSDANCAIAPITQTVYQVCVAVQDALASPLRPLS